MYLRLDRRIHEGAQRVLHLDHVERPAAILVKHLKEGVELLIVRLIGSKWEVGSRK